MLTGKKVFITGGAGFIGSTLAERLISNNSITIFDNFRRNSLKDKKISTDKMLSIVEGDVLDQDSLFRAMQGADVVIHCAAIAGIDTVILSPVTTMRVNMVGSANVLEAASR